MIGSRAGEIRGEALHAAGPAALMRVARAFRLEQRLMQREPRLAAPGIGERHRQERLVAEIAGGVFPGKGEDAAPLSGAASSRQGRHCASRPREMSRARSSTFRCFDTAGRLIANGSANSPTVASPVASRARIARRVGSANAEKVSLSRSDIGGIYLFG